MSNSTTLLKTPPPTKWVLNELAAQRGELQRHLEREAELMGQALRCEKRLRAIQAKLRLTQAGIPTLEASIDALQTSLTLVDPGTSPARVGTVRAHTSGYGKRGALKQFVKDAMRQAFPGELTTSELRTKVVERFGLILATDKAVGAVGNSIRWILVRLERDGLVHRPYGPGCTTAPNTWRWRDASPLGQLRALAQAQEPTHERPADPAGSEVDGK